MHSILVTKNKTLSTFIIINGGCRIQKGSKRIITVTFDSLRTLHEPGSGGYPVTETHTYNIISDTQIQETSHRPV